MIASNTKELKELDLASTKTKYFPSFSDLDIHFNVK